MYHWRNRPDYLVQQYCLRRGRKGSGRRCSRVLRAKALSFRAFDWSKFTGVGQPLGSVDPVQRGKRLDLFAVAVIVFGVVLSLRIYSLQGKQHLRWVEIAGKQHATKIEIQGARGTVYDTMGRPLAVSVQAASIGAHPRLITDARAYASALGKVLGKDAKKFEEKLRADRSFVFLARGVSRDKREQIAALDLAGIVAIDEFRRYLPQGKVAGPLIGRVSRDGKGLSGIELRYDNLLGAASLNLPVRRDARGRFVTASAWAGQQFTLLNELRQAFANPFQIAPAIADERTVQESFLRKEGGEVTLSIDAVAQEIVEDEFMRGKEEAKAKRVFGLVMDADSGEILALAQVPSFDPNRQENVSPDEMRSFVLQDSFEPGSTMKPIVASMALEQKAARITETMDCESGRYQVGKHTIRDVHPVGVVQFPEMLIRSSNICMTKIGQRLGGKKLHAALRDFGFGRATGIELPGEAGGILRPLDQWQPIDVATHSFGQGVSVTALQMVQAYAVFANGGHLVHPTIEKRSPGEPAYDKRVLSSATAKAIQDILQGVTENEHGTGRNARINGLAVHAKTGTAQKARKDGRGYDPGRVLASFVGFINAAEVGVPRRLVMLVAVDEPGGNIHYGGVVAAPVFKRSMERIVAYLMTAEQGTLRTAGLRATRYPG